MKSYARYVLLGFALICPTALRAQPTVIDGAAGTAGTADGNSGGVLAPGASVRTHTTTTTQPGQSGLYFPMGSDAAKANAESLPSSSRPITDVSASSDGFDMNSKSSGATVRGSKGAFAITGESVRAVSIPDVHTVRKGDTLWDLCDHYLDNAWDWPRIWSYNPDVRNPNWIYPGDQIRMRSSDDAGLAPVTQTGGPRGSGMGRGSSSGDSGLGALSRVAKDTIFLRNEAYIDDPDKDVLGEVVGANEEQMLLGQGNHVYVDVKPGVELKVGQQLTLFERSRKPESVEGARQPPGEVILIKGTIRISDFDPKQHVARAEILENNDAIERGVKVGSVGRRYNVVPTKPSRVTVWVRLLNGIYPHVYLGQQQLVFIDHGSEDGLTAGNRLLVVRRGDTWRQSLRTTARTSRLRLRVDQPEPTQSEPVELKRDDSEFPDEVVGELRIVHAHKWSSLAIVTGSQRELIAGDRAVAREGY